MYLLDEPAFFSECMKEKLFGTLNSKPGQLKCLLSTCRVKDIILIFVLLHGTKERLQKRNHSN